MIPCLKANEGILLRFFKSVGQGEGAHTPSPLLTAPVRLRSACYFPDRSCSATLALLFAWAVIAVPA